MNSEFDTVIIGGGLSGLATAYTLSRRGERVKVMEKSSHMGGAIRSYRKAGYLCEAGPNSMLVKCSEVADLLDELGLSDEITEGNPDAQKRFLVRYGRILPMPGSPWAAITTPLYRFPAKLRLLAEPFIARAATSDESVASFVTRRMGREFLDYGISALVSGIFAGDPQQLSIRHAFPKVWNLEYRFGSLIRGALALKRKRKRTGQVAFKSRLLSFRDGLERLPQQLIAKGGFEASSGQSIRRIRRTGEHWQIEAQGGETLASRLVLATPLDAYPQLGFDEEIAEILASLPDVAHPPLSTLVLGFDRDQITHPLDGFGALFPLKEQRFALGAIFSSTLFPHRAPDGKVSLMCFIGGRTQPENGKLPTGELVRATVADLRPLLGIKGDPEFVEHTFWPRAIPQYDVGHGAFIAALEAVESRVPGLFLRGNFRGGPGLNDCLVNAMAFPR